MRAIPHEMQKRDVAITRTNYLTGYSTSMVHREARAVILAYDFGAHAQSRAEIERKLERDSVRGPVLIICWTFVGGTRKLSENITLARFKAFVGPYRFLYDILFIVAAPLAVRRAGVAPTSIIIADFPLVCGAWAVKAIYGGKVVLRLSGLPREIARIRGARSYAYHAFYELLTPYLADTFVAINEATRKYLEDAGVPRERITVQTPDTITPDLAMIARVEKGAFRKSLAIAPHAPLILATGRLEQEKGLDELLRLFAQSNVSGELVIAGDGILRTQLEKDARSLGIAARVRFVGHLGREQLWSCLADADVFVHLAQSEALGLAVWEAMYMRVPVVGRPIGGVLESIGENGERGHLWNTEDGPGAFRALVERCVARSGDTNARVERARVYVQERLLV